MVSEISDLGIVVFALCFDTFLILFAASACTFAFVVVLGFFLVIIGPAKAVGVAVPRGGNL